MTKTVDAIARYLTPRSLDTTGPGGPRSGGGEAGPARYYVDGGEEPAAGGVAARRRWALAGEVTEVDLANALAGRDRATGARLLSAQGSAGSPGTTAWELQEAARDRVLRREIEAIGI